MYQIAMVVKNNLPNAAMSSPGTGSEVLGACFGPNDAATAFASSSVPNQIKVRLQT